MLAEDETDLLLFPVLRAGWALEGQPAPVLISGANARRVLFGTINIRTGHRLRMARVHQRGVDFQVFLQQIHRHYRRWLVALLLDCDSSHTARQSQDLAEHLNIQLIWLPKRSPHLNPMDHLWRHAKERISANFQYPSIDEHVERFIRYLDSLSSQKALRKAGVLSADFWLNQ